MVGSFPFAANGRTMSKLRNDGFILIVARADNHLVLGIQGVSELQPPLASPSKWCAA